MDEKTLIIPEGTIDINEGDYDWDKYDNIIIPSTLKSTPAITGKFKYIQVNAPVYGLLKNCQIEKLEITAKSSFVSNCLADANPFEDYQTTIGELIIDEGIDIIGHCAFEKTNIGKIHFPDSLLIIGHNAFFGADFKQEEIVLPKHLKKIEEFAFMDSNIKSIKFNDELEIIDNCAFKATKIEKFNLPPTVQYIGESAFDIKCNAKIEMYDTFKYMNFKNNRNKLYIKDGNKIDKNYKTNVLKYISSKETMEHIDLILKESPLNKNSLSKDLMLKGKIYDVYEYDDALCYSSSEVTEVAPYFGEYNHFEEYIFPNLKKLNDFAFIESSIRKLSAKNSVLDIPQYCFYGAYIEELDVKKIKSIGVLAFAHSGIENIDISEVTSLPDLAFFNSFLKTIKLNPKIKKIPKKCFSSTMIEEIKLPDELEVIEHGAFFDTKLLEVDIPLFVKEIKNEAFDKYVQLNVYKNFEPHIENKDNCNIIHKEIELNDIIEMGKSVSEINQIFLNKNEHSR